MASAKEYTTDRIRNVAVLGHGSSGKTSLIDTLCWVAGNSKRRLPPALVPRALALAAAQHEACHEADHCADARGVNDRLHRFLLNVAFGAVQHGPRQAGGADVAGAAPLLRLDETGVGFDVGDEVEVGCRAGGARWPRARTRQNCVATVGSLPEARLRALRRECDTGRLLR